MKAITLQADKQFLWQSVPDPIVGENDIAIQVHATAVNRADLMQRAGLYPPPPGASEILGLECAGKVCAVGKAVTQWQLGDRVCALLSGGGYAQTVVCPAEHAFTLPDNLSFEQGTALPEVLATAWLNLYELANLKAGEKVLLHAGASGVGSMAIQLCKAFDNPVFVTVGSEKKLAFCRELGADGGHIRSQGDFTDAVKQWSTNGVDVILDPVGADYFPQNLNCLRQDGRLILIGLMGGRDTSIDLGRVLIKRLSVIGSTLRSLSNERKAHVVYELSNKLSPLVEKGFIKPIIHDIMTIEDVDKAFGLLENNSTIGKVVLTLQH